MLPFNCLSLLVMTRQIGGFIDALGVAWGLNCARLVWLILEFNLNPLVALTGLDACAMTLSICWGRKAKGRLGKWVSGPAGEPLAPHAPPFVLKERGSL